MPFTPRFYPLIAPFAAKLLGPAKVEVEELHAAETTPVRPPAMLPGMIDRATDGNEHSPLAQELETALATEVTHAPVIRHRLRDALVRRDGFATPRRLDRYAGRVRAADFTDPLTEVGTLRYCLDPVIRRYFGHWLTDAIPTAHIEPELGSLWMPHNPGWGHAPGYLEALSLAPLTAPLVHAEELILYQDYGQGRHKQARYAAIRQALHSTFGGAGGGDCVYIRRGATGVAREVSGEDALIERLVARGWLVVDVATASVADLQRALCGARVVVSVDGSNIDHAHLSLAPGGVMVVLIPHDRFTVRQLGLSRAHGVSPGVVVMEGAAGGGYRVDLDEVLRTVDLAEAESGA